MSGFPELPDGLTLGGVYVKSLGIKSGQSRLTWEQYQFLERTDGILSISQGAMHQDCFWDLLFAYPEQLMPISIGEAVAKSLEGVPMEQAAIKHHWAFGVDDKDCVTELLLLEPRNFPSFMSELRTLSLDSDWLLGEYEPYSRFREREVNFLFLTGSVKLENVYLNPRTYVKHVNALASFPNLKHLSVPFTAGEFSGLQRISTR